MAAYVGDVIAGILEAMRLNIGGDPHQVAATFQELTADGTWSNHKDSGDTVMLVDLTIAIGLFEAMAPYARSSFQSPSGLILTYSPLFLADRRYWVVQKHERLGAKLKRELRRSCPGLTMTVAGEPLIADVVGIMAYALR